MNLYAIFDKKACVFSAPQSDINASTAIRNFTNGVNRLDDRGEHNMLYRYPDDYELYFIGNFDENTGHFSVPDDGIYPKFLVRAYDCIDLTEPKIDNN